MNLPLAVETPPLVAELAVLLIAAALLGYACHRVGVVPIVGYLVAGAVIGPFGTGIVDDPGLVEQMAEVGVIFLMFSIGLELSGDALRRMGWLMLGGGALQVGLTVGVVAGALLLFGVSGADAVFTGCLVALSSTAVVLKLLQGRGETDSPVGRVAVSFLIFQDLAVVIMVLLVPMLGGEGGGAADIALEAGKALLLIAVVLVAARWVVPRLLDPVSRRTGDEQFLFAILAIGVGIAWLVTLVGLTASLGAFIAGLVVSSGRHRERAERYVMPFQIVFAAVFFASIGMLLDMGFVAETIGPVLLFAALVVLIKFATGALAAVVFRQPLAVAAAAGLLLAQIGEFSFVLNTVGTDAGLVVAGRSADTTQAFIAVAVLLIALTPLLDALGRRVLARAGLRAVPATPAQPADAPGEAGAGRFER
jgi:CPA2 family monovalent cation:H+ antiporter-2